MTVRQRDLLGKVGQFLVTGALTGVVAIGCGIGLRRDFSTVPAQSVVFDDMCALQDYHDAVQSNKATAPTVISSTDITKADGDRPAGGKTTFVFETDFQLRELRRILEQNWKHVPDEIMKASSVKLEVRWAEKASIKRVVTDEDAELSLDRKVYALPYQPCLSDMLFGEALYATRRDLLDLPPVDAKTGMAVVNAAGDGDTAPIMAGGRPIPAKEDTSSGPPVAGGSTPASTTTTTTSNTAAPGPTPAPAAPTAAPAATAAPSVPAAPAPAAPAPTPAK